MMESRIIQFPSAALACEIYGEGKVGLVIEMGLGAVMAEWRRLAQRLSKRHTVLLYQRAGYGGSGISALERTPGNIALELHQLLGHIPHEEKVTLLGHSQGGLYVWNFAQVYPELVRALILLDPLSPEDDRFRTELTDAEFRKSGVDKTAGLRMNLKLTRWHLGWLVRRMMASAPPFYYDSGFSKEERQEILESLGKPQTYETALAEYAAAHDKNELTELLDRENKLACPVTMVTHDSALSCREIEQFGGASPEEAMKTEALWQEIMGVYLSCAQRGELVRAGHSSHYIHLTDPELVCRVVEGLDQL
ncbi:alpha/beta fold hydrolase [Ruminococcus sp. zg-924]|nr:alpha/beta hydrolase [Ruminococcus sp. zg-924]MCQ4022383.1 alpha/beta fold hydrolase [Ruminococcus sp. zg-924]MCQ4114711.1 alpha/beta fold hydrolase [Ruminococcus sp. zg-921]